jgi:hypothetical protein
MQHPPAPVRSHVRSSGRANRFAVLLALALAVSMLGSIAGADPVEDVLCYVGVAEINDGLGVSCEIDEPVDAVVCAPNQECSATVEDQDGEGNTLVKASLRGTSATGGAFVLAMNYDPDDASCGLPSYVPHAIRFDTPGFTGAKVLTIEVAKSLRHEQASNGVDQVEVCWQQPKPFEDQDGNLTVEGLLADCADETPGTLAGVPVLEDLVTSPCVARKSAKGAIHVFEVRIPEGLGDPGSWLK